MKNVRTCVRAKLQQVSQLLKSALTTLTRNVSRPAETVDEVQTASTNATHLNKAILGCLPRGRKLSPMPTECLQLQQFDISSMPEVQTISGQGCVKGSKLLRSVNAAEGGSIDAKVGLPKNRVDWHPKRTKSISGGSVQTCPPHDHGHVCGRDVGAEYSFLQ